MDGAAAAGGGGLWCVGVGGGGAGGVSVEAGGEAGGAKTAGVVVDAETSPRTMMGVGASCHRRLAGRSPPCTNLPPFLPPSLPLPHPLHLLPLRLRGRVGQARSRQAPSAAKKIITTSKKNYYYWVRLEVAKHHLQQAGG